MAVIETWFDQDLMEPVSVKYIDGSLFSHNGNANRVGVRVYSNGSPVTLSGTVSGYVVTSDGSTVPCTGSRSGNTASILVPAAAYQPGNVFISVFLTDGSTVTTLAAVSTAVMRTRTGTQVDPGSVVSDWTTTINAAMQSVTATAENMAIDVGAFAESQANASYMDLGNKWFPFRRGYYSTPAVNSTSSYQDSNSYCYGLVACQPGDVLHAHAYGDSTVYAWAFLDTNLKVLDRGGTSNFEGTVTAPANTKYVLVNNKFASMGSGYYAYVGSEATQDKITNLKSAINHQFIVQREFKTDSGKIILYTGGLHIDGGDPYTNDKRYRSDYMLVSRKSFRVVVGNDYLAAPFFYTKTGNTYNYLGYIAYKDSDSLFATNYNHTRIRFEFKRKDGATMTSTDETAIENSFIMSFDTDESLMVQYAAADAKAVGDKIDEIGFVRYDTFGFEFGGVNSTTGESVDNTIRVRTALIPITENNVNTALRFSCNVDTTNYIFKYILFYKDGKYIRSLSTGYDPELSIYTLDGTFNQFRITFAKPNDADFTQQEVDSFTITTLANLTLSGLETLANKFHGLKYAALGDSITYGYIPRNYTGYPGQLASYAELTAQRLGMSFVNYGISGSTMAYHATRNPMCRRYQDLPDDADLITVMGGTNDIRNGIQLGTMDDRTDSTYYGALHVVLGGLYKKYMIDQGTTIGKKKHIVVLTPIKLLAESASEQGGTGVLVDFEPWIEAVKEVAAYYSLPCLDFYNLSGINPHLNETVHGTVTGYTGYYNPYITDGTHPTQEGAEIMVDVLCGFLKTIM